MTSKEPAECCRLWGLPRRGEGVTPSTQAGIRLPCFTLDTFVSFEIFTKNTYLPIKMMNTLF